MADPNGGGVSPEPSGGGGPAQRVTFEVDGTSPKRGRPASAAGAPEAPSGGTIDPAALGGPDAGPQRSRGWPRGKSRGPAKPKPEGSSSSPVDVNAIDLLLLGAHNILSVFAGIPELALTQEETKPLAEATAAVLAHYPKIMRKIPPAGMAWFNLGQVAVVIYSPRFSSMLLRLKEERDKKAKPNSGFPPGMAYPGAH